MSESDTSAGSDQRWLLDTAAMLKAVKVIAAADGWSDEEEAKLQLEMAAIGVPMPVREEVDAFDPASQSLDALLEHYPRGGRQAKELIVAAIAVSQVDGYDPTEQAAVRSAAARLGISEAVVTMLETSERLGWELEQRRADDLLDLWGALQLAILEAD
jgi:tellurite resistance protein